MKLNLESGIELPLATIPFNDIVIRRISADNINHLFCSIKVKSRYPDERYREHPINPSRWVTPYLKRPIIDEINKVIANCKYKSLLMPGDDADAKKITLTLFCEEAIFKIDKVVINLARQINSYTYSIHPESYNKIRNTFQKARPAKSISVGDDVRTNFDSMFGSLNDHIIQALTGLREDELQWVKEIIIMEPSTKQVLYNSYYE